MIMTDETEYKDWLKNLKVGDKVVIGVASRYGNSGGLIKEVTEITKSGKIKISSSYTFNADGKPSMKKESWNRDYSFELIMPNSAKGREIIGNNFKAEMRELLQRVVKGEKQLTLEQLRLIKNVIDGSKENG